MPPDLALLSALTGSNYPCLELIFMVAKVFEPFKFDYAVKPVLVATSIKQATCIKQASNQFPKKENTLKCTCI